jgi:putative two-component system response regulator
MNNILIIDDDLFNRKYLQSSFNNFGLNCFCAEDGIDGLEVLRKNHQSISAITIDIEMPRLNGYQFAEIVKSNSELKNIPIIFISSKAKKQDILKALNLYAYDYLVKPVDAEFVYYKVRNAVNFYNTFLTVQKLNDQILLKNKRLENSLYLKNKKLLNMNSKILNILETTNHYNDEDTGNHIQRVAEYSKVLAQGYGLGDNLIDSIYEYAPLHDVGKVGIPDSILKKPGKLTGEEFSIMQKHVDIGFELVKSVDMPEIALNIVRYHHERWDGEGYGSNIFKTDIPIEARIVALADVFDALSTKRVYKEAFSFEKSASIIKEKNGTHFDPKLVEVFFERKNKMIEIMKNLSD